MNTPERTDAESPVLVENVSEFLAFDDRAINNPAELAFLKRVPQEPPVLVEMVGEFRNFDDPALRDPRELALLKRPHLRQDGSAILVPPNRPSDDTGTTTAPSS